MTPLEKVVEEKLAASKTACALAKLNLDYRSALQLLHIKQLEEFELWPGAPFNHIRIVASGPGCKFCPVCAEQHGKIFDLKEEIQHPHLPPPGCKCRGYHDYQKGFCLCFYEVVFDDEL